MTLKGNYYLNNLDKQFDADLNIVHFNIASLQGFSNGNISNAQGGIDGKLALNGKFANPEWMGSIHTKNTTFRLPKFGTVYTINNQYIAFDYPMITLKQFTIKDSADNALKIDGQLKANSFTSYGLNLKLDSKDFIVVHTEKATNDLIYGYAAINTDVNITGSTSAPNIQGALSLNDFSDATIVLPEKNVNKDAARSVVRFIDKDTFELPEKILFVTAAPEKPSITTFLNCNLNITEGYFRALLGHLARRPVMVRALAPATGSHETDAAVDLVVVGTERSSTLAAVLEGADGRSLAVAEVLAALGRAS